MVLYLSYIKHNFIHEIENITNIIKKPYIEPISATIIAFIGVASICYNDGLYCYNQREKVYRIGEETNYEIEYLKENIKIGESVYVYVHSVPGFIYKKWL